MSYQTLNTQNTCTGSCPSALTLVVLRLGANDPHGLQPGRHKQGLVFVFVYRFRISGDGLGLDDSLHEGIVVA